MRFRQSTEGSGRLGRAARPEDRPEARPEPTDPDRLWDIAEVAAHLHVSTHAVYKMTARKAAVQIPHIRIGGRLRFRRSDVDRWLTLLTVSNLDTLTRMRKHAERSRYGDDSQASPP